MIAVVQSSVAPYTKGMHPSSYTLLQTGPYNASPTPPPSLSYHATALNYDSRSIVPSGMVGGLRVRLLMRLGRDVRQEVMMATENVYTLYCIVVSAVLSRSWREVLAHLSPFWGGHLRQRLTEEPSETIKKTEETHGRNLGPQTHIYSVYYPKHKRANQLLARIGACDPIKRSDSSLGPEVLRCLTSPPEIVSRTSHS
ncbi:hypothetical protein J6590_042038 [Homalodisca vitripennis]|nr:hypothetical protein J6590_042038 [Homalodisca vitripennis]